MKSPNPHSGIYEAETARSLDRTSCGYPACNQGGMMVVEDIPVERERERSEPMTYDARGNGDGCTVCTITGDHNGHVSDYTALVIEDDSIRN